MTQKDIRDIAAYWGCKMALSDLSDSSPRPMLTVSEFSLQTMLGGKWDSIKLQLRSVDSLTDEEVFALAAIALPYANKAADEVQRPGRDGHPVGYGVLMTRGDKSSYHSDYWLSDEGLFGSGDGCDGSEISTYNEAAVFAYLQSIGVYVPGSIDPKYVQLINQ